MADTTFVDTVTKITASWLNGINDFFYTLFQGATTAEGARNAIELGTADSPQFTGIELGHASDTTLTRSAAGTLAVEGDDVATEGRANDFTAANTFAGSTTFNGPVPLITDYGVAYSTPSSSSGAITFDLEDGNVFFVTLTENITSITLSNPVASGTYCEIVIEFLQDSTGGRTVAWPASVKWPSGEAPVITTTATTGRDKVFLSTRDGGTTWLGEYSQDYS